MLFEAVKALAEYIEVMKIDCFAFPAYGSARMMTWLVNAQDFLTVVTEYAKQEKIFPMLEMRSKEAYFRLRARYTATVNGPFLKNCRVEKYNTPYKRLSDMPPLRGIESRTFEVVTALATGGQHTGDNKSEVDVILQDGRRVEVKKGHGILAQQTTEHENGA